MALLEIEHLTEFFGGLRAVSDFNIRLEHGEIVGLIGPNGAGKTTILRLIMGLAKPNYGTIEVFGRSPQVEASEIGYVPQYMNYDPSFPISVAEVVRMGMLQSNSRASLHAPRSSIQSALEKVGVADLIDRPYRALSGGQRRRFLLQEHLQATQRYLFWTNLLPIWTEKVKNCSSMYSENSRGNNDYHGNARYRFCLSVERRRALRWRAARLRASHPASCRFTRRAHRIHFRRGPSGSCFTRHRPWGRGAEQHGAGESTKRHTMNFFAALVDPSMPFVRNAFIAGLLSSLLLGFWAQ